MKSILAALCVTAPLLWAVSGESSAHGSPSHHVAQSRVTRTDARPLFSVKISGGFVGITMKATVYADGTVITMRQGGNASGANTESHVPLYHSSFAAAVAEANRAHVFAIPKSLQDKIFGADIPVLSFTIYSGARARSVHAMGGESNHVAGTAAFFRVWGLLYALAGYPQQVHQSTP